MLKKSDLRLLQHNYNAFTRNVQKGILDAYNRPSRNKLNIWNRLMVECSDRHGRGLSVISNNSHFFTAGFEYPDNDTGELRFRYYTAYRTLDALVSDFEHI